MQDDEVPPVLLRILISAGLCALVAYAHGLGGAVCEDLGLADLHNWASSISTTLTFIAILGGYASLCGYLSSSSHVKDESERLEKRRCELDAYATFVSAARLPPAQAVSETPTTVASGTERIDASASVASLDRTRRRPSPPCCEEADAQFR